MKDIFARVRIQSVPKDPSQAAGSSARTTIVYIVYNILTKTQKLGRIDRG